MYTSLIKYIHLVIYFCVYAKELHELLIWYGHLNKCSFKILRLHYREMLGYLSCSISWLARGKIIPATITPLNFNFFLKDSISAHSDIFWNKILFSRTYMPNFLKINESSKLPDQTRNSQYYISSIII